MKNFVRLSKVLDETISIIERRANGEKFGYTTGWSNLNKALGGGITFNTNFTIAGRTGTGKSAFANILLLGILENNPDVTYKVIYWNWEMLNYQQGLRIFSNKTSKSVNQLMSSQEIISKEELENVKKIRKNFDNYEVYMADVPYVSEVVKGLVQEQHIKEKEIRLINFFDHTRLVLQGNTKTEEEKIHKFFEMLQFLKKQCNCTNIILSQLNRKVDDDFNRSGNYRVPILSDLFGADAVAQYSETVLLLHRPEIYNQLYIYPPYRHNGETIEVRAEGKLVAEIAKNRDGPIGRIFFEHNLEHNNLTEWKPQIQITQNYQNPQNYQLNP